MAGQFGDTLDTSVRRVDLSPGPADSPTYIRPLTEGEEVRAAKKRAITGKDIFKPAFDGEKKDD